MHAKETTEGGGAAQLQESSPAAEAACTSRNSLPSKCSKCEKQTATAGCEVYTSCTVTKQAPSSLHCSQARLCIVALHCRKAAPQNLPAPDRAKTARKTRSQTLLGTGTERRPQEVHSMLQEHQGGTSPRRGDCWSGRGVEPVLGVQVCPSPPSQPAVHSKPGRQPQE